MRTALKPMVEWAGTSSRPHGINHIMTNSIGGGSVAVANLVTNCGCALPAAAEAPACPNVIHPPSLFLFVFSIVMSKGFKNPRGFGGLHTAPPIPAGIQWNPVE